MGDQVNNKPEPEKADERIDNTNQKRKRCRKRDEISSAGCGKGHERSKGKETYNRDRAGGEMPG
jgi:hypothetical protein